MPTLIPLKITARTPAGFTLELAVELEKDENGKREKLIPAMQELEKMLLDNGYTPVMMTQPTETAAPPPAQAATQSFLPDRLTVTIDGEKEYFRVKGAQFSKHGVVIYPEVLHASGIDPEEIDIRKGKSLRGWVAHYVLKENGQPQKVVRLVKSG